MTEQFKVAVPPSERVNGWLYDAHSGILMGIASDELKAKQPANTKFKMAIAGCPHDIVIHHG